MSTYTYSNIVMHIQYQSHIYIYLHRYICITYILSCIHIYHTWKTTTMFPQSSFPHPFQIEFCESPQTNTPVEVVSQTLAEVIHCFHFKGKKNHSIYLHRPQLISSQHGLTWRDTEGLNCRTWCSSDPQNDVKAAPFACEISLCLLVCQWSKI